MRAYCVKCRDTKEIPDENTTRIMNKRDIPMLQGKCLDCGKVCNTFLKREGGTPRVRVKKPKKESAFGAALGKKLKERKKKKLIEEGEGEVTPPPPPPPDSPPPPVPPPPPSVPEE